MRNKIEIALVAVLFFFLVGFYYSIQWGKKQKERADRQTENVRIMQDSVTTYRTASNRLASEVEILTFKKSELSHLHNSTLDSLKSYKKKLANVSNVTTITTKIVDTLYIKAQYKDSIKYFQFSDNFISLHGEDLGDLYKIDYSYRGKYDIVREEVRKRFLGFLWRTKKIKTKRLTVITLNPKEKVENILTIDLE